MILLVEARAAPTAAGAGPRSMPMRDACWLAPLAACYAAAVLAVGPGGDFPLNDDWSFAGTVRRLVEAHAWRPVGWSAMTQLSHALLGAAACELAPCSHETLRAAELLAGLGLLAGCFALLRGLGAPGAAAALGAGAVVLNPVLLPLAFSFMTDVDFALLVVLAALASAALLRNGRWRDVALATAAILAATMGRQLALALALPLAALVPLATRGPLALRCAKGGLPFAACAAALLLYERWMRTTGRLPALYDGRYRELAASFRAPLDLALRTVDHAAQSGLYLGLICLPALLWVPLRRPAGLRGTVLRAPAAPWAHGAALLAAASLALRGATLPTLPNVLWKAGVGPFTLRDTYVLRLPDVPELPAPFWAAATALGLLGLWRLAFHAASLCAEAWPGVRAGRLAPAIAARLFGAAALALCLLPLLPGLVFDRYVAVAAPLACMSLDLAARRDGRALPAMAAACAAAGALVAVLATHDGLGWNRARWAAIRAVEAAGEAGPATMDGGFEYGGESDYDEGYVERPDRSWWWVRGDRTVVAFGALPGTEVVRRVPYATWLPPGERSILVLRRTGEP